MFSWGHYSDEDIHLTKMKNKTLANWLIGTFGVIVVALLVVDPNLKDLLTSIGGVGLWVFGIWAIVKLYKTE